MFQFWECISQIMYVRKLNRHFGDSQWCIQECWAIYFIRSIEILEGSEWDIHARSAL
jgi:hypothetical protein